jgi:hypothetical protein
MVNYLYQFNISKKEFYKNIWVLCLLFGILFLFNGFRINKSLFIGNAILLFGVFIYNILLCKSFRFTNRTFEMTFYFLPSIKIRINIDEINKIKVHFRLKGRDLPFIKFYLKNHKIKTVHFVFMRESDILEIVKLFEAKELIVDEI